MLRRILIIGVVLISAFALAEGRKKLILKNGDYQVVQKYEIKGDRVRYYSAERSQWEEIPSEMIDWDATHKLEAEQAKEDEPKPEYIPTKEEIAKQLEEDMSPEVAPNLRLPKTGGVFVVDDQQGQPKLVELTQNTGNVNQHIGRNLIMRKVNPLASKTQSVELAGSTANAKVHVAHPVIYINVDEDPDDPNGAVARKKYRARPTSDAYRFRLVKLNQKGNSRILGTVKTTIVEETERNQTIIPTYGRIMDGDVWIKVEPKDDLPPGEYAIAEMLPDDDINRYVWDFSVNVAALPKEATKAEGKKKSK